MTHHPFNRAAQDDMSEAGVSVRSDNDEVGRFFLGRFNDLNAGPSADNYPSGFQTWIDQVFCKCCELFAGILPHVGLYLREFNGAEFRSNK